MEPITLFSTAYLPPVRYYSELLKAPGSVWIEKFEHYPKQTYRNRAVIATANGPLSLTVPVKKGRGEHRLMKDIRISYGHPWQRLHWLSIETAYRSSAYFEFYEDALRPFYEHQEFEYLIDFNTAVLQCINRLLKVDTEFHFTGSYQTGPTDSFIDYRGLLHPRVKADAFKPYYQVFADKTGFLPGLSIVDLLFNLGTQSKQYL